MDDSSQHDDSRTPKYSAPKDKNCPFCAQPFTSSSLGRHLDVYIKDKNPKPADGVHDVEAIRKMRGNITRRQPRGSTGPGPRRGVSTPIATPKGSAGKDAPLPDRGSRSSGIPKDGHYAVDSALGQYPYGTPRWELGGAMGDAGDGTPDVPRRPGAQRSVSRQAAGRAQFDARNKVADAMDTARAAELALRELLASWRAAKLHIDANSMPFDFDPLSLDFPALTLQCLQPPPTLFSSTQHPTSTSWAVQSPGKREYDALCTYFQEHFQSHRASCQSAAIGAVDELTYPPSNGPPVDKREQVRKAEKAAESLEKQVNEHLQSAYAVWDSLPAARQNEVWILELARSVGRKHKEGQKMKEQQRNLEQENLNLKSQIEQLNRMQHPREFKMLAPQSFPMDRDTIALAYEQGVKGASLLGFQPDDQKLDLGELVSRSIERWKTVVMSSRAGSGMSAQKPLDQPPRPSDGATTDGQSQTRVRSQSNTPQQQAQPHQPPPSNRNSTASTSGAVSEHTTPANTGTPSVGETSDQDADAEMEDDDSFAMVNHQQQQSPQKQPAASSSLQQQATLEVPRARRTIQQQQQQQQQQRGIPDQRFMMQNGTGSPVGRAAAMNMSRSMPNMNMAMQSNAMHAGDIGLAMQGMRGDAMYME